MLTCMLICKSHARCMQVCDGFGGKYSKKSDSSNIVFEPSWRAAPKWLQKSRQPKYHMLLTDRNVEKSRKLNLK